MKIMYLLIFLLSSEVVRAACMNQPSAPCRYPEGDNWCYQRYGNIKPYAYKDNCSQNSEGVFVPDKYNFSHQHEGVQGCSIIPKIKQKMDYDIAVDIIKNAGWQSSEMPPYGYSKNDEKVISECMTVERCNNYPEIEACSGSGYCKMKFWDCKGQILYVSTYGELGDGAYIRWWSIEQESKP